MLMEALFSRGGYPIHHRINGFNYVFRRNDDGAFVCPVLSGEHRQMMVKTGNFRAYAGHGAEKINDVPLIATRPKDYETELPKATESENADIPEAVTEPVTTRRRGGRRNK